jgi:CelD/BcsL family acetyltransferase involved in cellulose biosynthesis
MVVAEALTDEDDFLALKNSYQTYCKERYNDVFFNRQMKLFPIVFEKAAEMGKLITLKCYLEEKLVAVNYSIIEGDTVYDYICYRNPVLSDRSLGIFAILENIKHVQKRYPDCKYYDLASEFDYKRKFVNCEKYHTVFNLK